MRDHHQPTRVGHPTRVGWGSILPTARRWPVGCIILLLTIAIVSSLAGCAADSGIVPLPASAKPTGASQLTVPFPYGEQHADGTEQWFLDTNTSGHRVLGVTWRGRDVATFPVDGVGANPVTGTVTLGGKDYRVVSVVWNGDDGPYASGYVVLEGT